MDHANVQFIELGNAFGFREFYDEQVEEGENVLPEPSDNTCLRVHYEIELLDGTAFSSAKVSPNDLRYSKSQRTNHAINDAIFSEATRNTDRASEWDEYKISEALKTSSYLFPADGGFYAVDASALVRSSAVLTNPRSVYDMDNVKLVTTNNSHYALA